MKEGKKREKRITCNGFQTSDYKRRKQGKVYYDMKDVMGKVRRREGRKIEKKVKEK